MSRTRDCRRNAVGESIAFIIVAQSTMMSILFLLLAIVLAQACSGLEKDPVDAKSSHSVAASESLPTLQLRFESTSAATSPAGLVSPGSVGPHGEFYLSNKEPDRREVYAVLDSTGTILGGFGISGDGPGEFKGGILGVTDSAIVVTDPDNSRISQFSHSGELVHSTRVTDPVSLRLWTGADVGSILGVAQSAQGLAIVEVSPATGSIRRLVPASDSFLVHHFEHHGIMGDGTVHFPVLGQWEDGFVVADGFAYVLALYRWNGELVRTLRRELPPPQLGARRLAAQVKVRESVARSRGKQIGQADEEKIRSAIRELPVPFFVHNRGGQIRMDAKKRIWVLGVEADSGFADVFSASRFLGRIALPCDGFDGGWSLNGDWLLLACLSNDESFDADAVVRLFKIID